jgi:sterol desaturase/sphingolipid hydroxylase (fatty acid hydroxylase superfamily)
MDEDIFYVSIVTFIIYTSSWIVLNTFYLILDKYKLCQQYRVTNGTIPISVQINVFKDLLFTHVFVLLPSQILCYPLLKYIGLSTNDSDIPTIYGFIAQFILLNVVEDFIFYWVHRSMHHPYLYKNIHIKHHKFDQMQGNTFSLNGEYASYLENIFNDILPIFISIFMFSFYQPIHITLFWIWIVFRQIRTSDSHSGYDFPYSPLKLIYFVYGGSRIHIIHHSLAGRKYNFGGLRIWDKVFGTEHVPS